MECLGLTLSNQKIKLFAAKFCLGLMGESKTSCIYALKQVFIQFIFISAKLRIISTKINQSDQFITTHLTMSR